MASATVHREWPDGEFLAVTIDADESFPDAIAEVRQAVVRAYEDALEITLTPIDTDADEDVV